MTTWKMSLARIESTVHPTEDVITAWPRNVDSRTTQGVKVIVVCDGCSSYSQSEPVAYHVSVGISKCMYSFFTIPKSACNNGAERRHIDSYTDDEIRQEISQALEEAFDCAIDQIKKSGFEATRDDMLTTAAFFASDGTDFIMGNLGDGITGVITPDDKVQDVLPAENGRYLNQTYYVNHPHAMQHLRLLRGKISIGSTYFIMTDGTADCLYDRQQQTFAPALFTFRSWLRDYDQGIAHKAIVRNMNDFFPKLTSDDCSLVLVHATP